MHILKTQLVSMYHQLYFLPPLSCFHAHLLALSHIYIYTVTRTHKHTDNTTITKTKCSCIVHTNTRTAVCSSMSRLQDPFTRGLGGWGGGGVYIFLQHPLSSLTQSLSSPVVTLCPTPNLLSLSRSQPLNQNVMMVNYKIIRDTTTNRTPGSKSVFNR